MAALVIRIPIIFRCTAAFLPAMGNKMLVAHCVIPGAIGLGNVNVAGQVVGGVEHWGTGTSFLDAIVDPMLIELCLVIPISCLQISVAVGVINGMEGQLFCKSLRTGSRPAGRRSRAGRGAGGGIDACDPS